MKKTDGTLILTLFRTERSDSLCHHHGQPGDIIVAGKGHEDYQEIKGVKYPMDERNIIAIF